MADNLSYASESDNPSNEKIDANQARVAQELSQFIQYNFHALDKNNNGLIEKDDLDWMLISSWSEIPSYQTIREKQTVLAQLAGNDGDGGISRLDAQVLNNAFNKTGDSEPYEQEKTDFLSVARFGLVGLAREWNLIGPEQFKTEMPDNYYAIKREIVLSNNLFEEHERNLSNQRMGVKPSYMRRAFAQMSGLVKTEIVKD